MDPVSSEDRFANVPSDIIRTIAFDLSPKDILALCKTSRRFNLEICKNPNFWIQLIRTKFPGEENNINNYGLVGQIYYEDGIPMHRGTPLPIDTTLESIVYQLPMGRIVIPYIVDPIKFSSWIEFYQFLHHKYDTIRLNHQIDLAEAILQHPDYKSKSDRDKKIMRRLLVSQGLPSYKVEDLIYNMERSKPTSSSYQSFRWDTDYVTLNGEPILAYINPSTKPISNSATRMRKDYSNSSDEEGPDPENEDSE